jgi:hypothetical protein
MRRRDFFLSAATAAAQPRTDYELSAAGKRLAALHAGPEFDKPFLYPIHTPAGKVLSRGFPLAPAPGESNDHGWHRGFFYGHGIVNGHDFWRELGRDKTSRLVTDPTTILHKRGQLSFASSMVTPSGDAIGTVSKRYAARATGPMFLLEASINISANRGHSLSATQMTAASRSASPTLSAKTAAPVCSTQKAAKAPPRCGASPLDGSTTRRTFPPEPRA